MRWTASGLLLAVLFVLVFAGTLSGAFGIENSLQQNGIIESNVASAANVVSTNSFTYYAENVTLTATNTTKWENNQQPGLRESNDWKKHFGSYFGSIVYDGCWNRKDGEEYTVAATYALDATEFMGIISHGDINDNIYYAISASAVVKMGARQDGSATITQKVSIWISTSSTYDSNLHGEEYSNSQSTKETWTYSPHLKSNVYYTNVTSETLYFGIYYDHANNRSGTVFGADTHDLMMLESFTVTIEKFEAYSGGTGSENDPYILANRTDFDDFSRKITLGSTYSGKYFEIKPDNSNNQTAYVDSQNPGTINMTSTAYVPGGVYDSAERGAFEGHIDGNNVRIENINISLDSNTARAALIGTMRNGEVKNIIIASGDIKSERSDAAAIVGYLTGGTVQNCVNYATISSSGHYVGGIVSNLNGSSALVKGCKNYGSVTGAYKVGGITGIVQNGTVENCYNDSTVTGTGSTKDKTIYDADGAFVGGIAGVVASGNVQYCYSTGAVKATKSKIGFVAGIASAVQSGVTIQYCFAKYIAANISTNNTSTGKGFVIGHTYGSGNVDTKTCWAFFDAMPDSSNNVGQVSDDATTYIRGLAGVTSDLDNVKPFKKNGGVFEAISSWENIVNTNINSFSLTYHDLKNGNRIKGIEIKKEKSNTNSATTNIEVESSYVVSNYVNNALDVSLVFDAGYYTQVQRDTDNIYRIGFKIETEAFDAENKINPAGSSTYGQKVSVNIGNDEKIIVRQSANGTYSTSNPIVAGYDGQGNTLPLQNVGTYYYVIEYVQKVGNDYMTVGYDIVSHTVNKRSVFLKDKAYYYGARISIEPSFVDRDDENHTGLLNGHNVTYTFSSTKDDAWLYGAIDSTGSKSATISINNIVVNGDATITNNYDFDTEYTLTINEGDFGVQGTDDIANNLWGSENNPYIVRTQTQLERLAQIVADGVARNSVQTADFPYVKAQVQQNKQDFANCYFKLTNDLSMSYTSLTYSNHTSNPGGYDGQVVGNLFDNNTNSKLFVTQSSVSFEFEVNVATKVYSYSFNVANDTGNSAELKTRNPKSFKLEGYNGSNWVVIDERENTKWSTTNFDLVTIINMNGSGRDGSYSKFRVTSSSSGTNGWQISEFRINNPLSGSNPIGTSSSKFAGTFDGDSHTISNFKTSGQYSGLFGYVDGATIKYLNLSVENTSTSTSSAGLVGVVGDGNGTTKTTTISNCHVSGSVKGSYQVGGIVGFAQNCPLTIENCTNSASVTGASRNNDSEMRSCVGGFVGYVNANASVTISKSTNSGKISTTLSDVNKGIGGFVGYAYGNVAVEGCTNNGIVEGNQSVGGIVGFATSLTINGAINSGTITGTGGKVAGIVGYSDANGRMYGVVKNSGAINGGGMVGGIGGEYHGYWCDSSNNYGSFENSGAINGGSGSAIGGITGFADKEILSAVNKGDVIGGSAVGGIAGRCQAPVKNSYNEANIHGTVAINPGDAEVSGNPKGVYVGGIVGYTSAAATILHCYNTGNIKACNADGTYLGSSNYVGGIVGFAQVDVSYCANIGGIIEGNDYIGGIVGKSTSTINYCYDVEGQRILRYVTGRIGAITGDAGTVANSWAVKEKTYSANLNSTATPNPTISTRGHLLTTAFAITPLVIDNGSYNEKVWTDILTQDINGFKVVGNVAANNFFVTDNGKSGTNLQYVNPTRITGFGDNNTNGDVTAWYSATINSDISAHAEAITLPTGSTVYNGSEQGFGYTTYPNTQSGATANTPIVYTSLFVYLGRTESSPTQVDVYNVTVTIKIGDQIVGKTSATYTITPCEITITWTWTQYFTANNGLSAEFEYNALAQGLASVDRAGYDSQFNVTGNVTGNNATIIPAGDYSRTYTLKDARNYVIKNNNSSTITFSWKINAYNIESHLKKGEVWFGGSTNLIVGNQLTSKVNGNGVDYYPLQVDVKGTSGVQQVLVYSRHNYSHDNFILYVQYNDGSVVAIEQGTEYNLTTLQEPSSDNNYAPIDTRIKASGEVNFTGDITRYYTALYSDFGGNVTSDGWGSEDNPYFIDKPEYLLRLSQIVNGGMAWNSINTTDTTNLCYAPQTNATATSRSYNGAFFRIGAKNIDMDGFVSTDGITNFLPIGRIDGSTEYPFSGTFDGNGNTIDYIYDIYSESLKNKDGIRKDYIGLFGYTDGATIENFTLMSGKGSGEISGNDYVGFVVGYARNSTISNVRCEYGKTVQGNDYVGGVAGKAENTTIKRKGGGVYKGSVQGREYVGGVVGLWIVKEASQIGGNKDGQSSVTTIKPSTVHGFRYVGGLVGYLDASGCNDNLEFTPRYYGSSADDLTVKGTEYVGALFGVLIGNGYHDAADSTISTAIIIDAKTENNTTTILVGNVNLNLVNYGTGDNIVAPQVVGGLIGYIESAGLIFNTSYNTSSIKFDFGTTTPSVLGGVVGILGKNATIENCTVQKPDGTDLFSGNYTLTNDVVAFGSNEKPLGSFVGGIAGFVSSQAGTAYESSSVGTTYIFGNAVHLVNAAEIYATGFAGGLFGAMGNVNSKLLSGFGFDADLLAILTTGVREDDTPRTNLGVAPSVGSPFVKSAAGKMQNSAHIVSVTDSYVGGLIGYVGDKVTLTLTNKTTKTVKEGEKEETVVKKFNELDIFSGSSSDLISIHGNYAGGLVGYLSASAHRFEYIAVQAQLGDGDKDNPSKYEYVGGLVGYMANGTIEHCVATTNNKTTYNSDIDNFKGANFVGGLVGYVLSATINNSFTAGFNFASTSETKGGIIGAGQQPNISASWTIYIAQSGAKYAKASKNQYGKYISFDDDIDKYNVDSITEAVFKFAGFGGATTTLDFRVTVPNANESGLKNKQLVFYDASGDDEVTDNTFSGYENVNDVLSFGIDAENGTSMQVYIEDIKFVNIPKHNTSGDDSARKVVKEAYRKPSNSDRYDVTVETAVFNVEGNNATYQVTSISGVVLFNGVIVGTTNKTVGNFSEDFTPGSVETPYTISNITEWNNFATAVKNGNSFNDEDGQKHVRLLADLTGVTFANLAGASGKPFAGIFDGNGHTISIGTISGAAAGTSLFPYANGATFKNLTVTGTITSSASGIAGFVGSAGGSLTFENCKNQVTITGGGNLGGLVGETYADANSAKDSFTYTFIDCVNEANIEGSNVKDTSGVGGIVGNVRTGGGSDAVNSSLIQSKVDLESCRNKGNITGKYNVAGIFGREGGNATVKNCANTGNITAYGADGKNGNRTSGDDTYAAGIGGLITDNAKIDVFASYNKGNVLGWGNKAGGILAADCSYDQSGSTSKIYYCYNTGNVTTGGSSPQTFSATNALRSYGGMAGGILGGMVNADIQYCYNAGEITANGIIGVEFNWTYRLGGIVGYSDGVSNSSVKYTKIIRNCYNVGIIRVGARGSAGDVGVGVSPILGSHVDTSSASWSLPVMENNYALKDCVRHKPSSGNEWAASARAVKKGSNSNTQWGDTAQIDYINNDINGIAGKIVESVADMTALNTSGNTLTTTRTTSTSGYEALGFSSQIGALGNIEGTSGGYIFVYGCLPQLAVFALDTKNGLAMTSKGYGQNLYGEFVEQTAGGQFNPYIIKDGIDLMGLQALVEAGYDFDKKYIEFADGTNNLDKDVVKSIDMSTTKATGYTFTNQNGSGKKGKSYHLYTQGAIFNDAAYNKWSDYNYYATTGGMADNATLEVQNMLPIGRGDTSFKGTLIGSHMVQYSSLTEKEQEAYSGKKYNLTNGNYVEAEDGTYVLAGNGVVSGLRISADTYGGLFAKAEDATIAYVGVSGDSIIRAYANNNGNSMAGGIVALALGSTTIEHCSLEGAAKVEAYGDNSYAGGIVGVADTKKSNAYNAGTVLTISGCIVDTSGHVESTDGYIGGIVGYVEGQIGDTTANGKGDTTANGKGNTVRIENGIVKSVTLQAFAGGENSHHIGGVIGYGSSYVPAYITGCEVGGVANKSVNINGEYALGGITGAMSNAVGGFIDSCSVGAGTTITCTKFGSSVSEDGNYGTAIGGLVGYTESYQTKQVTTTFSGENTFAGNIIVNVETDNSDAKASNIGGIVGDMGNGANFASGSHVTVSGTITIGDTLAAQNVGGVAGRTNTATFIGTFDVHPTMTSPLAKNVGGFIGKNAGATYVLADISRATDQTLKGTTITIGSSDGNGNYSGSISAASNVGGIIGLNSAGSVFGIGSNNVDGTNYNKGTLHITIYATITGTGNNVGGIVGLNESTGTNYGVVSIVRGVIVQNGAISGASYVGGIVGYDNGVLETGGATADSSFSEDNQKLIIALSITNKGNVKGCGEYNTNDAGEQEYVESNYVGGFIGRVDEPRNNQKATGDDVDIAGTFTNDGLVEGDNYVGGLIGYVGKGITIGTKNGVSTEFKNSKNVIGHGNYIGGSIGLLLGTIKGDSTSVLVKFENGGKQNDGTYVGNVDGKAYVGGSIGVIAGNVEYAQFVNLSTTLTINADTAVGGSVGYLGVPNTLKDKDEFKNISISVQNSHFEANGTLTVSGTSTGSDTTETGGVGGAIGVIGSNVTTWSGNTYYARGNVTAGGINNVGGIIGLIKAANIAINNMLAYDTTVSGATNVGGIVGATTGAKTQIVSAYAIEGNFTGTVKGGIIGFARPDTVASTSYWVKGYANEEIAGYDVEHLDNLGFTTGTEQTGWFFLYANDANGTGDLGKINTKHSTAAVNNNAPSGAAEASEVQADDAELKYWKRIADAYTASERANGEDDNAQNPLTSTIVKGFGAPQKGTLYATATAASVSASGYYMYVATSGTVKPTIEYGNVENNVKGYLISVQTVKDGDATTADDTTEQSADTAGNVAVFYRSVSSAKDALIYNGYLRNAIIGLDGVDLYETPIADGDTPTITGHKGKYIFTATTKVEGGTTEVNEAQSDPNTYISVVKIYYVDDDGVARLVGGNTELKWSISERDLTVKFDKSNDRVYGSVEKTDDATDMTITIGNIAPKRGTSVPIRITVSYDNDKSVVFEWNGTSFSNSQSAVDGVKLKLGSFGKNGALSDDDKKSTSEDITDESTYQIIAKLFFEHAKIYTVTVSDGSTKARYKFMKGDDQTSDVSVSERFQVTPAVLTLKLGQDVSASGAYDGKEKDKVFWVVSDFKYSDGIDAFALFKPSYNVQYEDNATVNTEPLTADNMRKGVNIDGTTCAVEGPDGGALTIRLSSAIRKGKYYLTFETTSAGNYTLKVEESSYSIVKIQIKIECDQNGKSKVYDQKGAELSITFTASAPSGVSFDGIEDLETFVSEFFDVPTKDKGITIQKTGISGNTKFKVTWKVTTDVNAKEYVIGLAKGSKYDDHIENCSHIPAQLPTYKYTIIPRQLTLTATQTGTSPYTYNTSHQGLKDIKVDDLQSNDTIGVTITVDGKTVTVPLSNNNATSVTDYVSTIDATTYKAVFALSSDGKYPLNGNYTLTASDLSWTIEKYKVTVGAFDIEPSKTYDAEAVIPVINVTSDNVTGDNGAYTYYNDTFTLTYTINDKTDVQSQKLVNAGTYIIKVGGASGKISAKHDDGSDASDNYAFDDKNAELTYEINPCPITINWENKSQMVYSASSQKLKIASITIGKETKTVSNNTVKSGLGIDSLTFNVTVSGGGVDVGSYTTTATLSNVGGGTNDGVIPSVSNYSVGNTSKGFSIIASTIVIEYASGKADKVYDATTNVVGNPSFTFTTRSINGGHSGSSDLFTIGYKYKDKNVGQNKKIVFTYTYSGNNNYQFVGDAEATEDTESEIRKATFIVLLNKLRNGKATRTFTNDKWYGGGAGATNGENSGRSSIYRSGEGFQLTEFPSAEDAGVITVKAYYIEAENNRSMFDSYVNNVYRYKNSENDSENEWIYALDTTKHYKALVFTMEGDGKDNYTFNVCDSSKNAYNSTAGDSTTSVTVYDSNDADTKHKNANGSSNISIEITVKTYKVEYDNTAQSYANADNTYNTDWQRVVARNVPDEVTVTVSNGWMFADGKDHSDSEQAEKKQYTGYTTIRGSQNNVILGAKISGQDGMELNYKMSNQPILTIGYFVAQGDEFEIGSAASLMIASYYWTIAQNKDNPDFNQELVAGSRWHTVVSNHDYINTTYTKPADAPKDIPDNLESWDDYFAAFEKITGKTIFLNETGVLGDDGNWGYYEETETSSDISYTKFKLVRNFSGVLTDSDIAKLNAFFRVYNKNTQQYESVEWGYGGTYIVNFLKSSVSSTLTALGSVFMSVENAAATCEFDGNGYVIEYLNIMGYGKSNVGFFDIVGSNSVVKNLHLRNVTINANQGNVGGIAGSVLAAAEAASESSIANVSFHGTINASGGVVGGLFGNSARAIDGAIVLGTITANGATSVGGVVGVTTASISNVVSLMQVTAYSGTVGAFTATQGANVGNSVHMTNAVWLKPIEPTSGLGFVNVEDKNKSYTELMNGSISGYGKSNKYYYAGETPSTKGTYDVLADVKLISSNAIGADNPANARESMRLKDLVYVYLLMYSLTEGTDSLTESTGSTGGSTGFTVKVYKLSSSSWLVGKADGTSAKPVAIANKQNVSLLRQLPFATFTLKTNVTVSISNTFAGAFFGTVASESGKNYKITCNNAMFEAYADNNYSSWLTT